MPLRVTAERRLSASGMAVSGGRCSRGTGSTRSRAVGLPASSNDDVADCSQRAVSLKFTPGAKEGAPVIYFVNDCAGLLGEIKKCGADVVGIDWRIDLSDAIKKLGKKMVVQGNLDPCALFLPKEKIEDRVKDMLWKGEAAKGHIFNLGHGVIPQTPVENVIALVEAVHAYGRKR